MFIVNNRKFFFILSALLVVGSIVAVSVFGLNFGIDFKGGSKLEVSYNYYSRPDAQKIKTSLDNLGLGNYILTPSGNNSNDSGERPSYILKTRDLSPSEKEAALKAFQLDPANPAKEESFNSLGPIVGTQLKNKAMIAIAIVVLCIVLFITFAFRKVSRPVASWKY